MKGAIVLEVEKESIAAELGLEEGDRVVSINNNPLVDLIQFQYDWVGEEALLEIEKKNGEKEIYEIEKDYDEPLGVIFNRAVFDGIKPCRNKCLFCFVDQMPRGMRPSLYIKDDDYRISFLQGSFITLTNLKKKDIERIKREKLSPLYVSVHTTDPELREKMLNNPEAGRIVPIMKELAQNGIEFHTQIVLCPGINDREALKKTFNDLYAISGVRSVALVPVGITQYREDLPQLRRYSLKEAQEIVAWAEEKQRQCLETRGTAFVWPADEFYLTAQNVLPEYAHYEDFPQLENGVGMVRLFWEEFEDITLPEKVHPSVRYLCVTGESGQYALEPVIKKLNSIKGVNIELRVLKNCFFGPTVTVTGLLTGACLLDGLQGLPKGSRVIFPDVLLKGQKDRFLDNLTVHETAKRLNVELIPVPTEPQGFIEQLLAGLGG